MTVDISSIVKKGGSVDFSFCQSFETLYGENLGLCDVAVQGKAASAGEGMAKVCGSAATVLKTRCDRCLKELEVPVELEFDEKFAKNAAQDEDVYPFSGDELLLDRMIVDNILVALPTKVLCDENCKGLCPFCGADLNKTKCTCQDEVVGPTITAFKVLRIDEEEV